MQEHVIGKIRVLSCSAYDAQTLLKIVALHRAAMKKADKSLEGKSIKNSSWQKEDTGEVRLLKITPHRSMSLVRLEDAEFFVKHFHPSEFYKHVTQRFRGESNARVIGKTGLEFQQRGLHVPEVLGIVDEKGSSESFLIMRSIAAFPNLRQLLESISDLPEEQERRARKAAVLRALAKEWHRLHRAGIDYPESHARHIYVAGDLESFWRGEHGSIRFEWIDYDGSQFLPTPLPATKVCRDFFKLSNSYRQKKRWRRSVSHSDMMRFLYFYLQFSEEPKPADRRQLKSHAREIAMAALGWQPRIYTRMASPLRAKWRSVARAPKNK